VAIVSNSQMQDAISLSHLFEQQHPGHPPVIRLAPGERGARQDHRDVSTKGGEFATW